jgi:hypothetical protein
MAQRQRKVRKQRKKKKRVAVDTEIRFLKDMRLLKTVKL